MAAIVESKTMLKEIWHVTKAIYLLLYLVVKLPSQAPPTGKLLLIAPHPDDEIIGAGGLLLAAVETRNEIHIIYLTDGEKTGAHDDEMRIKIERIKQTETVRLSLGVPADNIHRLHLTDGSVSHKNNPGFSEATEKLICLIDEIRPTLLLATHHLDYWPIDHVACSDLAITALNNSNHKPRLFLYWVWAWYNINPWRLLLKNYPNLIRVDILKWTGAKSRLLDIYMKPRAPSGVPWCGKLPWTIYLITRFKYEILEEINVK